MANALWWVECEVTTPSGEKRRENVSLSSPDLRNAAEAHSRARATAEARELRRQQKLYGASGDKVCVKALTSRCVG